MWGSNLLAFRDGCRVLYTILVERLGRCRNPHDDWRPAFLELEAKCARTPGHVARRRGLTRPPPSGPRCVVGPEAQLPWVARRASCALPVTIAERTST